MISFKLVYIVEDKAMLNVEDNLVHFLDTNIQFQIRSYAESTNSSIYIYFVQTLEIWL